MAEFKLVIADPKTGKCIQKTVADQAANGFIGLKIGDALKGEVIDLTGYEFEITGGSDFCGFPMRKGIAGARKKVLIGRGVGFKGGRKGMRRRKTVCGEAINDKITQINLKITKHGAKKLETEAAPKEGEAPKEKPAKAEEKPKEEAKEAPKEKPAEKPAEAPKKEEK